MKEKEKAKTKVETGGGVRGLFNVQKFSQLKGQDLQTTYRQIWRGKIKVLKRSGRYLIPASQLQTAQLGQKGMVIQK